MQHRGAFPVQCLPCGFETEAMKLVALRQGIALQTESLKYSGKPVFAPVRALVSWGKPLRHALH